MAYEIKKINIFDTTIEDELLLLFKDAFGYKDTFPKDHIAKTMFINNSSSFILAAVEDDKIIGCNGFIETSFLYNDKSVKGYQSCWSATHPKHQGRKIFVSLILYAMDMLEALKAAFIYGLPNNTSYPIFIKKLKFKEIDAAILRIPNIPVIRNLWFKKQYDSNILSYHSDCFLPKETDIYKLKCNMVTDLPLIFTHGSSMAWGKIRKATKYGIKLNYFYVGGIHLDKPSDMKLILKKIMSLTAVSYVQIIFAKSNRYSKLLNGWNVAKINPFIFFDLNPTIVNDINLSYGAIDVF